MRARWEDGEHAYVIRCARIGCVAHMTGQDADELAGKALRAGWVTRGGYIACPEHARETAHSGVRVRAVDVLRSMLRGHALPADQRETAAQMLREWEAA